MSSEFQRYAVETAGKEWSNITFDEKLRLREIFDKKPSSSGNHSSNCKNQLNLLSLLLLLLLLSFLLYLSLLLFLLLVNVIVLKTITIWLTNISNFKVPSVGVFNKISVIFFR